MVGEMVQNSRNQNHFQQQPIYSLSFYFNNNIGPISTTNTTTKTKNTPNPEKESQSTSTTIAIVYNNKSDHLKTNVKTVSTSTAKHIQQFGDERLAMVVGGWDRKFRMVGHAGRYIGWLAESIARALDGTCFLSI